jgi:hypothetical protein
VRSRAHADAEPRAPLDRSFRRLPWRAQLWSEARAWLEGSEASLLAAAFRPYDAASAHPRAGPVAAR